MGISLGWRITLGLHFFRPTSKFVAHVDSAETSGGKETSHVTSFDFDAIAGDFFELAMSLLGLFGDAEAGSMYSRHASRIAFKTTIAARSVPGHILSLTMCCFESIVTELDGVVFSPVQFPCGCKPRLSSCLPLNHASNSSVCSSFSTDCKIDSTRPNLSQLHATHRAIEDESPPPYRRPQGHADPVCV